MLSVDGSTVLGMDDRPPLTTALTGAELRRWYWTLAELTAFARTLGVPTGGGKPALTERMCSALDGTAPPAPVARRPAAAGLRGPLTGSSVLPPGQRCSQELRYLGERIGPRFRFDAHVREFVAAGAGRTLDGLVAHWEATRTAPPRAIEPQFEFNRFLRRWHLDHPDEPRAAALAAWRAHRAHPRSPGAAG